MYKPDDITLYVPCYNAWASIDECLEGILDQTVAPGKILFIDDGSDRPLFEGRELPGNVELIRLPENRGLANARNTALSLCRTALIASLDSDVVPEPQWLETLLDAMNSFDIAGAAGRLDEFYQDNIGDRWRAVHMAQHWGDAPVKNPRFLYGANNIFKTDILRELDGYHSGLRTNYEDMHLSNELYEKGFSLYYTPSSKCRHLRKDTEKSILKGFWKWYHAKGLINGEFDTPEGLIDRIKRVNFGIAEYRYNMDKEAGSEEFLLLDSLIPWVFCSLDLELASNLRNINVPSFPTEKLTGTLLKEEEALLMEIITPLPAPEKTENWHDKYIKTFQACL